MEDNYNELNPEQMEEVAGGAGQKYIVYVVQKGDNLSKIANRYHVTVAQLVKWNKIPDPNLILVGQKLRIFI